MPLAPGKNPKLWAALAGLLVVAIPILFALHLASVQSLRQQERHAALLANELLQRSHGISTQIARGEDLLSVALLKPCSPAHVLLMARMTAENPLIVAFGHVQNDRLLCSTFGNHGAGLSLGPPDYRSRLNRDIRAACPLPGITNTPLLLSTTAASGYTAIIHPDVVLNFLTSDQQISLGVYNPKAKRAIAQRGSFDAAWIDRLGDRNEVQFSDGLHIVALQRSELYDYATYAAITVDQMDRATAGLILLLVPLGVAAGFILALIVFRFTQHRMSILWHFRRALRHKELFLVYQPVVDMSSGRWVGAEALLRWRRADGTLVSPEIFIPMAERHQLIGQVTAEVIRLFVRDLKDTLRTRPDFHISLNFAAADLENPALAQNLHRAIVEAGLQHSNVQVEATERGLVNADRTRQVLRSLQALGIRVAIDDFGTGYSSLSYLTTLEVDCLKIDKAFVETIGTDAATSQVVAHIIEMAKSLELQMIAEGVETQAQADYLRAHGVQHAQGWLFSRPLSPEDLSAGLQRPAA